MSTLESRLLGREEIADRTMAFHFARPAGFTFKPGQAVDVILASAPGPESASGRHTFSLVSAPFEDRLTVATRLRDSAFKRALGQLPVGAAVGLEGPFGSLTLHRDHARGTLLIAGGIGVTPFMSMLRQAARDDAPRKITLIYSNHRPEDSAWLPELRELESRLPGFSFKPVMTAMNRSTQAWAGLAGRIDAGLLRTLCANLGHPVVYVAGSPTLVASMRSILDAVGVDDDDIRSEEFHGY